MTKKLYILPVILFIIATSCSVKDNSAEQTPIVNLIESPSRTNSAEPFLFTDSDSTVYLSWVEKGKDESTLRFSSLKNGKWSEPLTIASGKTWFVNWADYPMIASNGKNLVAHFLDKSGEGTYAYDVKLTTSEDGGNSWVNPIIFNEDKKQAEHGFVTLLPFENSFFITWLDGEPFTS